MGVTLGECPIFPPRIVKAARRLIKEGKSRRAAASTLEVSYSGLSAALVRKKKKKKETRGRKGNISKAIRKAILKCKRQQVRLGRNPTAPWIRRKFKLTKVCSEKTVQRLLKSDGDEYLNRRKKGVLTPLDMKIRLKWAQKNIKKKTRDWKRVHVWIDAKKYRLPLCNAPKRSPKCYRKRGQGLLPWAVAAGPKHRAPGCNILSGFGDGRVLFKVRYTWLNGPIARELFRSKIIPALRRHYKRQGGFLIMADGDRSLQSQAVKDYLSEVNSRLMEEFPARSGDIALMENAWNRSDEILLDMVESIPKWRRGVKNEHCGRMEAWTELVLKSLGSIKKSYLAGLVGGMRDRLRRVIAAKGARIKN